MDTKVLSSTERYQLEIIAILVQKLGGKAIVTDKEMHEAFKTRLTLKSYNDPIAGHIFTVDEDS